MSVSDYNPVFWYETIRPSIQYVGTKVFNKHTTCTFWVSCSTFLQNPPTQR